LGFVVALALLVKKGSGITLASLKVTCQARCQSHRNLTIENHNENKAKFRFYRYVTAQLKQHSC
jgi:hypothetical protein